MANGPKRANIGSKKMGRRQKKKMWVLPFVLISSDLYEVERE